MNLRNKIANKDVHLNLLWTKKLKMSGEIFHKINGKFFFKMMIKAGS